MGLNGKTLADACGNVVEGNSKWMTTLQNALLRALFWRNT